MCVCVYRRSFDGWLERRSRRGKLRTDGVKRWRVLVQCLVTALPSDNVTRKRFFFSHQGIWNRSMMRSLFPISLDYLSRQRNEPFLHFHGFRVSISLFGRTSSTFDVRVRNFKRKLSSISGKVWNEVFRRSSLRACKVAIKREKVFRGKKLFIFEFSQVHRAPINRESLSTRGERALHRWLLPSTRPGVGVNVVNDPVTTIRPTGTTIGSDRITRLFL